MSILLMSVQPAAGPPHAEWLTVSQAAARLGISPRAVQKRCKRGTIVARRKGARWEVAAHGLAALQAAREDAPNANPKTNLRTQRRPLSAPVRDVARHNGDSRHNSPAPEFAAARTDLAENDAGGREGAREGETAAENLIAHLEREVLFLRALVEQHQSNEAELRAALREALRALPKAITVPDNAAE